MKNLKLVLSVFVGLSGLGVGALAATDTIVAPSGFKAVATRSADRRTTWVIVSTGQKTIVIRTHDLEEADGLATALMSLREQALKPSRGFESFIVMESGLNGKILTDPKVLASSNIKTWRSYFRVESLPKAAPVLSVQPSRTAPNATKAQ